MIFSLNTKEQNLQKDRKALKNLTSLAKVAPHLLLNLQEAELHHHHHQQQLLPETALDQDKTTILRTKTEEIVVWHRCVLSNILT